MNAPRFKIGDIINSSLSSPQIIEEIRVGIAADFAGRHCDCTGELCYVLRYMSGKRLVVVHGVTAIDSDHHLKGEKLFDLYEEARAGL